MDIVNNKNKGDHWRVVIIYLLQLNNGRLQESSEHRMFLKDFSW